MLFGCAGGVMVGVASDSGFRPLSGSVPALCSLDFMESILVFRDVSLACFSISISRSAFNLSRSYFCLAISALSLLARISSSHNCFSISTISLAKASFLLSNSLILAEISLPPVFCCGFSFVRSVPPGPYNLSSSSLITFWYSRFSVCSFLMVVHDGAMGRIVTVHRMVPPL